MAAPLPLPEPPPPRRRRATPVRLVPARLVPMSAEIEVEVVQILADLLVELAAEDESEDGAG